MSKRITENTEVNSETKSKYNFKDLFTNIVVLLLGIATAFGVFVYYKNFQHQQDINALIPNAKIAYDSKQFTKSLGFYQEAKQYFPTDIALDRQVADIKYKKSSQDEAITSYEKLQQETQLTSEEISNLGNLYFQKQDFNKVIDLWSKVELSPKDKYVLAKSYLAKKDYDNYFESLTKLKEYQEPTILLQIKETNLKNILANIETALTLPKVSDEEINIELFKSQIQDAKKQIDSGKKDYSEFIQLTAFSNLKQCYMFGNRISNLRTTLTKQKIPTFQIDFLEGKCKNESGDVDNAISLLNKAVDYDSTNTEYREELANSYFIKKDVANVKETYQDIFLVSKDANLYLNYGSLLYQLDQIDDSVLAYKDGFKQANTDVLKQKFAKYVMQISVLSQKNISVCSQSEYLQLIQQNDKHDLMILNHCSIYLKNGIDQSKLDDTEKKYFDALKNKNKQAADSALDEDTAGFITTYYNAVGVELIK